jgi:hypothetical protein
MRTEFRRLPDLSCRIAADAAESGSKTFSSRRPESLMADPYASFAPPTAGRFI